MKIRTSFVTNSSYSSYIICFARIKDEEKARPIIEKHNLKVFDAEGVDGEKDYWGTLGADWAGAVIWGVDEILDDHPNDKYIIIEDWNDAYYDDDYEPIYDYDFSKDDAISDITEENGFIDIDVQEGEGRNG